MDHRSCNQGVDSPEVLFERKPQEIEGNRDVTRQIGYNSKTCSEAQKVLYRVFRNFGILPTNQIRSKKT